VLEIVIVVILHILTIFLNFVDIVAFMILLQLCCVIIAKNGFVIVVETHQEGIYSIVVTMYNFTVYMHKP
jgi:hypothetical protein